MMCAGCVHGLWLLYLTGAASCKTTAPAQIAADTLPLRGASACAAHGRSPRAPGKAPPAIWHAAEYLATQWVLPCSTSSLACTSQHTHFRGTLASTSKQARIELFSVREDPTDDLFAQVSQSVMSTDETR